MTEIKDVFSILDVPQYHGHAALGQVIGETFRDRIQAGVQLRKEVAKDNYPHLVAQATSYIKLARRQIPDTVDLIEGYAKGANIQPGDDHLLVAQEVLDPTDYLAEGKCTTIVAPDENSNLVVGHLEDWDVQTADDLHILKAQLANGLMILALVYTEELFGTAAVLTSSGKAQTVNSLNSRNTKVAVPRVLVASASAEQPTHDQAENLIHQLPQASGYSYTIVQDNIIKIIEVVPEGARTAHYQDHVAHTNHPLNSFVETHCLPPADRSLSRLRQARQHLARQPIMGVDTMKEVVSDRTDPQFPICNRRTVAAVVIEPSQGRMHVRRQHPYQGEFVTYSL